MRLFGMEPVQIVIVMAIAAVLLIPVWKILTRMGFSVEKRALMTLAVVVFPGFGLYLLLWIVALAPWPALGEREQ